MDEFPEMLELRDVVFLAKLLLVPVLEGLPDVRLWRSSHAKLVWKVRTDWNSALNPNPNPGTPRAPLTHQLPSTFNRGSPI